MRFIKEHLLKIDWIIFSCILLLSFFGLIEIYSISLQQESISLNLFERQIIFLVVAVLAFFSTSFIDYKFLKSFNTYIYLASFFSLILLFVFGHEIKGATSWFYIFGISIQPVEFAKIALVIFLASFFSQSSLINKPFKTIVLSFMAVMTLVVPVFLQPDFGPSAIMLSLWFIILVLAGMKRKYIILIIGSCFLLAFISWNFYLEDYQRNRVLSFINPTENVLGDGYNASQALIAVGSGGLTGTGLGLGSQSQLRFLPEAHNDFIFSVISEELGFLGVMLLMSVYLVLFSRLLFLLGKMNDDFSIFYILGALVLIFIEMFINIGMNIGIVPIMGISLPFVSYGGSAIVAKFVLLGLMQNMLIKVKN